MMEKLMIIQKNTARTEEKLWMINEWECYSSADLSEGSMKQLQKFIIPEYIINL